MKFLILLATSSVWAVPTFTQSPSLTSLGGGQYRVEFTVSESTDVEISIVKVRDSSVVRHLAAGRLCPTAPAPLTASSLHQTLTWDGRDDYGAAVSGPDSCSARVRAGMSVAFHQAAGFHPYSYSGIKGVAVDRASGAFFVYGITGQLYQISLRQYDAQANYVKTVFPYSGLYSSDQVRGFGVNLLAGNAGYAPKYSRMVCPEMETTIFGNIITVAGNPSTARTKSIIGPEAVGGQMVIVDPEMLTYILMGSSGTLAAGGAVSIIKSPVVNPPFTGPVQVRISADQKYFYITGVSSGGLNGKVMKSEIATGAATAVINVGTGPVGASEAAAQGIGLDDAGHIFVCDRLNHKVRTYDTTGAQVDSLAVTNPYLVEVNKKTGEMYVMTRQVPGTEHTGIVSITKYSSWHSNATVVASLPNFLTAAEYQVYMVMSETPSSPVLCVASSAYNQAAENSVWFIRDDGSALTVFKNFYTEGRGVNNGFDRVTVDRRTEVCYINDSWSGVFQVWDWRNPAVTVCTTSTGSRLWAGDFTISPSRELYVRTDETAGNRGMGFTGPIDVYSLDRRPVYKRRAIPSIYGRYGPGGYGDRGLAVTPSGNIAVMFMKAWDTYNVALFNTSGSQTSVLVDPLAGECGGVKYDLAGNLYVGAFIIDMKHEVPGAGFAGDHAYWNGTGSVVKFPSTGGSISVTQINSYQRIATNALKIYPQDLSPYSGSPAAENCRCRSPRFELDPYGRLFMPSAFTCKVNVADNNGNRIARFGRYGNVDDPLRDIPLAWPTGVAASEDYIYVTDMVNSRIMRLKMNYALDNIPGLTEHGTSSEALAALPLSLGLSAAPNPCNAHSRITLTLPDRRLVRLDVFDANGRFVRTLKQGVLPAGVHGLVWNGADCKGRPVAPGLYVYRLMAGKRALSVKTLLTR